MATTPRWRGRCAGCPTTWRTRTSPSPDSTRHSDVRHHSLTDTAFAALGAGRPDIATIRELRHAQLGRHLLLLREIVRVTTPPWYAPLAAADPAELRRALTGPL